MGGQVDGALAAVFDDEGVAFELGQAGRWSLQVFAMPEEGLEPPTRGYDSAPLWVGLLKYLQMPDFGRFCNARKYAIWGPFRGHSWPFCGQNRTGMPPD